MIAHTPEALFGLFVSLADTGAVDDAVELFDPDAIVTGTHTDRDGIRAMVRSLADPGLRIDTEPPRVSVAGDTALIHAEWRDAAVGTAAPATYVIAMVARRGAGGGWRFLIADRRRPERLSDEPALIW